MFANYKKKKHWALLEFASDQQWYSSSACNLLFVGFKVGFRKHRKTVAGVYVGRITLLHPASCKQLVK